MATSNAPKVTAADKADCLAHLHTLTLGVVTAEAARLDAVLAVKVARSHLYVGMADAVTSKLVTVNAMRDANVRMVEARPDVKRYVQTSADTLWAYVRTGRIISRLGAAPDAVSLSAVVSAIQYAQKHAGAANIDRYVAKVAEWSVVVDGINALGKTGEDAKVKAAADKATTDKAAADKATTDKATKTAAKVDEDKAAAATPAAMAAAAETARPTAATLLAEAAAKVEAAKVAKRGGEDDAAIRSLIATLTAMLRTPSATAKPSAPAKVAATA